MLARVIVPESASSSQLPHQRKYRIYGNDRSKIGRLLSGLCVRCGLNPGSAVLRGGVDSETCEPVDSEKLGTIVSPSTWFVAPVSTRITGLSRRGGCLLRLRVPQPLTDKPGYQVHCFKTVGGDVSQVPLDRLELAEVHGVLHDLKERCCTYPVEHLGYQVRVGACASEEYNRDREERIRARRFLSGLCGYCGKAPAIWVCEECENRLIEEDRYAMKDANRTFFEEFWQDNPSGYIGKFGIPPDW